MQTLKKSHDRMKSLCKSMASWDSFCITLTSTKFGESSNFTTLCIENDVAPGSRAGYLATPCSQGREAAMVQEEKDNNTGRQIVSVMG